MRDTRALIVGRYQPFHLGHLKAIETIAGNTEEIIIGIGSAQESHTLKNPFTSGERIMMIKRSLSANFKGHILPIPDLYNNAVWVSHVVSLVPEFHVVYSRNPLVKRLFKEADFEVREQPLFNKEEYSGTEIRKRIIEGDIWEDLVPKGVLEIIEEIDGVNRLKELA